MFIYKFVCVYSYIYIYIYIYIKNHSRRKIGGQSNFVAYQSVSGNAKCKQTKANI